MVLLASSGSLESFVQFLTVLFLFVFVIVISFYVTKWVSGVQREQMTGRNMEVLETVRLSNSKYLQIVRVGDKYLVIAVCKDTVTMLAELSADSLNFTDKNEGSSLSFKDILDKLKNSQNTQEKTNKEKSNL